MSGEEETAVKSHVFCGASSRPEPDLPGRNRQKGASARDWRAQEPRPERRKRARPIRQARGKMENRQKQPP